MDAEVRSRLAHLNMVEFSREMSRWSGPHGHLEERDGMLFFATASPFPAVCNGAWALDPAVEPARLIAAADRWFGELGRGYSIWADDAGHQHPDLGPVAADHGLTAIGDTPAMVVAHPVDEPELPDDVELRWVHDHQGLVDFAAVGDAAFASIGLPDGTAPHVLTDLRAMTEPHIGNVVAYLEGRPVAAAQVVGSGAAAGVYWVGTLPEARGHGFGEAVTAAVTNRGLELGATFATLQASSMGEPIYARMGYQTIYTYRSYARFD